MTRTGQLIDKLKLLMEQATELDNIYKSEHKGESYNRRMEAIQSRFNDTVHRLENMGKTLIRVYKVYGVDYKGNHKIYEAHFTIDISEEDVLNLIKFRSKLEHITKSQIIKETKIGEILEVK